MSDDKRLQELADAYRIAWAWWQKCVEARNAETGDHGPYTPRSGGFAIESYGLAADAGRRYVIASKALHAYLQETAK